VAASSPTLITADGSGAKGRGMVLRLDSALHRAALDASLYPVLLKRSEQGGWFSEVGPRGRLLSGGERQRVCLARCLYRQERSDSVMLIDEGTASLDIEAERTITKAIMTRVRPRGAGGEGGGGGGAAIVVAHRLASVRQCNLILVLREGKVVESGSHEELLRIPGGWYAECCRSEPAMS
jgi:ABC-type multidrug transport system fused ATPase/permease subunit